MHKSIFIALIALTFVTACKKTPAKVAPPPTSYIEGALSYRSGCRAGPAVPFPGQAFDGGPVLYLTDAYDHVKTGYVKPDALGRFSFAGVGPGDYRLHLAAGALHELWVGYSVSSIRVVVPSTPRRIALGVTCADTEAPRNVEIEARWLDTDYSTASNGGMLHLEEATGGAQLIAWGDVDGQRRELSAEWYSPTEGMKVEGTALSWAPGALTGAALAGMAGDGKGSFVALSVPLRMHSHRVSGLVVGGWQAFSDPATWAVFSKIEEQGAVISPELDGARFVSMMAANDVEATLVSAASYLAVTLAVSAVVNVARLDLGAEIELAVAGMSTSPVSARLRVTGATAGWLELVDSAGGVVAATPWKPTPSAIVELRFDAAAGQASAAVGEFGPANSVSAIIALSSTRPAERLAPRLTLRTGPSMAAGFDVTCEGLYVSEQARLFTLPVRPRGRDDVMYSEFPYAAEPGAVAYVESGLYFGAGDMLITMATPRPLSTYLINYQGSAATVITDQGDEWVSRFSTLAYVDRETMAPINAGRDMLY